jgi:hypothetical protein
VPQAGDTIAIKENGSITDFEDDMLSPYTSDSKLRSPKKPGLFKQSNGSIRNIKLNLTLGAQGSFKQDNDSQ